MNCQLLCKQKEQVTAMACYKYKIHVFINKFTILNSLVKNSYEKLLISFEKKGNKMFIF